MPIHDLIAGQTTTVIEPKPYILPISLKPWCLLPELLQCNACSCLYWGSIWQASGNASLARGMHWYTYNSHISSLSGTLHLFCRSLDIPKMFLMTTPGILPGTSSQLSMSSVTNPGTCWYFCATPEYTSDNSKKGKYSYMQNVQFHANSHYMRTSTNPYPPTPYLTFLFPGGISLIVELTSKINQCPLPF